MRFIIIIITSKSLIITSKSLTGFYDTRYLMFAEAEGFEKKKKKKRRKKETKELRKQRLDRQNYLQYGKHVKLLSYPVHALKRVLVML